MSDVIVNGLIIRLRHPVHEAGLTNVFAASTQEWVTDADGVVTALPEKGPFTPQQLDAKGLTLPVIVDQALQTAMRDRVDALAVAMGATDERDAAFTERDAAVTRAEQAEAALEICQNQGQALAQEANETFAKMTKQLGDAISAREASEAALKAYKNESLQSLSEVTADAKAVISRTTKERDEAVAALEELRSKPAAPVESID